LLSTDWRIPSPRRRTLIHDTLGYESCAGVGHNKVVAKIAGEQHRPNQQTCVLPCDVIRVIAARSLRKIPGMGRAMVKQLASHGVEDVSELPCLCRA